MSSERSRNSGYFKKATSVSPAREFEKLTISLALADAANRKLRPKSHSPTATLNFTPQFERHEIKSHVQTLSQPDASFHTSSTERTERAQINLMKEEYIYSYDFFQYRIGTLYHKTMQSSVAERIIVLFTAKDLDGGATTSKTPRVTWCKDCNYLESIIAKFKYPKDQGGYLIRAKVGTSDEWISPSNPYRLDKTIRLKSIPTIMVWGTNERLAGKEIFDVNQLVAIFDESIQGDPWRRSRYDK